MGCEQILTFEETEQFNRGQETQPTNLLLRTYKGLLSPDAKFTDTLIKSDSELIQKLRDYIPSQIEVENDKYDYNYDDDILTKTAKINFDGKYMIYHDNQPKEKNSYIALVVKKIDGFNPKFIFASPKRPFI